MPPRSPDRIPRPLRRLTGQLAAGSATSNGGIQYECIPVAGALRMRVTILTATNGGTLDVIRMGPDFSPDQLSPTPPAYAAIVGTKYTTGNGTAAVTAGTEAKIDLDLYGESYVLVKFTGSVGAGTISYCDVGQLAESGN